LPFHSGSVENHDHHIAALRGKATLGIVTVVEVDLLPITSVYGGSLFFDGADSAAVLPVRAPSPSVRPRERNETNGRTGDRRYCLGFSQGRYTIMGMSCRHQPADQLAARHTEYGPIDRSQRRIGDVTSIADNYIVPCPASGTDGTAIGSAQIERWVLHGGIHPKVVVTPHEFVSGGEQVPPKRGCWCAIGATDSDKQLFQGAWDP
jgi:hypothetical protein